MSESRRGSAEAVLAGFGVHALVPAAGRGERFGAARPKQFLVVHGRPLLDWTVGRLLAAGLASVTVALPGEWIPEVGGPSGDPRVVRVLGGATRQASVAAALQASPAGPGDLIAVHDGARPATSLRDLVAVVEAAVQSGGAVLGRAIADTVKRIDELRVVETVDRRRLFRAETPQVFRRSTLERALALARADRFVGTDESSLVERLGEVEIRAVAAADPNPKVTVPADLPLVEWLLSTALTKDRREP